MNFHRITVAVGALTMAFLLAGCAALRAPEPSPSPSPPSPEIPEAPSPPAEPASPATVVEAPEPTVESTAKSDTVVDTERAADDGATVKPAPAVTVESIEVAPADNTVADSVNA